MARVTGIGGVFFKAQDPKALAAWYATHLGMRFDPFGGAILRWSSDEAKDGGLTVWHLAEQDSDWFAPSQAPFMLNYRVDDHTALLAQLEAAGVELLKGPDSHEQGSFAWILDPEGNKLELWEPKALGE